MGDFSLFGMLFLVSFLTIVGDKICLIKAYQAHNIIYALEEILALLDHNIFIGKKKTESEVHQEFRCLYGGYQDCTLLCHRVSPLKPPQRHENIQYGPEFHVA